VGRSPLQKGSIQRDQVPCRGGRVGKKIGRAAYLKSLSLFGDDDHRGDQDD